MMRFEVLVGDVVVGWTELENGDPPMGVALGRLHPTRAYAGVAPHSTLRVRPVGGDFFEPSGGVHIEDHSADLGADAIEVSVLGLDAETYNRYFASHVQAYQEQCRPRRG